jgi:predicted flap endonuclease-1-like 5' DNA nuclease
MLYLASQFVWFLAAAFALGFVMGWIGRDGSRLRLGGAAAAWFAAFWAAGAGLTWLQFLNGTAAVWVESALLFTAAYIAGCMLGALVPTTPIPTHTETEAPAAVATLPPVAGEADIPGRRPSGLVAAKAAGPDDLKQIKGIGRQNEDRLQALGIWHFEQIAAWTPENAEWVGSYLAFPGRIEREDWVGQAKTLAAGGDTEFAKRVRAGQVETSRDEDEPAKA